MKEYYKLVSRDNGVFTQGQWTTYFYLDFTDTPTIVTTIDERIYTNHSEYSVGSSVADQAFLSVIREYTKVTPDEWEAAKKEMISFVKDL